jgi:hypothetical protein
VVKAQILVVRVYQWRRDGKIAGMLETALSGEQRPFRSFRELRREMIECLRRHPAPRVSTTSAECTAGRKGWNVK